MKNESGEAVAVVANEIIKSRHRLDPRQQKLLAWAISQISRDDEDFETKTLTVSEFSRLLGSSSGSVYREMEVLTKSLMKSLVEIKLNDGDRHRVVFQWVSECDYYDGLGYVKIRFHERLKPYLLELKSRFTQLKLERFFRFRSTYSIRFFERIEMQRGLVRPCWEMTMDELRDWLGLDEKTYPKFGLLRKRVLEAARDELNAKSDWSFTFVTVKTGRKITGVQFKLRSSSTSSKPTAAPGVMERWKNATAAVKQQVLEAAHKAPWAAGLTDDQVVEDSRFLACLVDYLDKVEKGQSVMDLVAEVAKVPTPYTR